MNLGEFFFFFRMGFPLRGVLSGSPAVKAKMTPARARTNRRYFVLWSLIGPLSQFSELFVGNNKSLTKRIMEIPSAT